MTLVGLWGSRGALKASSNFGDHRKIEWHESQLTSPALNAFFVLLSVCGALSGTKLAIG